MAAFPFGNPFTKKASGAPAGGGNSHDKLNLTSGSVPVGEANTDKDKPKGESDDPMLQFDKLWQPNLDAKGNPIVTKKGPKTFVPQLDQKAMAGMLERMDFTKDFTAEEMAAVTAGGEGAMAAFSSMINKATKRSFLTAFQGAQRMTEHAVQAARQDALSEVPDQVRSQMIDSELSRDNVLMSNPAYKPMVDTIKKAYQEKYPKATPAEINKGVRAYFDNMVKDMNKSTEKVVEIDNDNLLAKGDANADWETWFEVQEPPASDQTQGTPQNNESAGVVTQP